MRRSLALHDDARAQPLGLGLGGRGALARAGARGGGRARAAPRLRRRASRSGRSSWRRSSCRRRGCRRRRARSPRSARATTTSACATPTAAPTATSCARFRGPIDHAPDVVARPRDEARGRARAGVGGGRRRGGDPVRRRHERRRRRRGARGRRLRRRRHARPRRARPRARGRRRLRRRAHPGRRARPGAGGAARAARAHAAPLPAVVPALDARRLDRDARGRPLRDRRDAHRRPRRVGPRDHAGRRVGVAPAARLRRRPEPRPAAARLGGDARRDHRGVGARAAEAARAREPRRALRRLRRRRGGRARGRAGRAAAVELPPGRRARGGAHVRRRRLAPRCSCSASSRPAQPVEERMAAALAICARARRDAGRSGAGGRAAAARPGAWREAFLRAPVPARRVRRDGRAERDVRDGDHVGALRRLRARR